MLYKVTPNLTPQPSEKPAKDPNAPKIPRKRRKSAVYDADGNEVLITMMCLKCRAMKPLVMFGLRKMADGAIRNQPWCRGCRSGAGVKKPKEQELEAVAQLAAEAAAQHEAAEGLDTETTVETAEPEAIALLAAAPVEV